MVLTKKELGKLIKSAREMKSREIEKRYTQRMLASDIGKSQSYIGDIESGRTYPSFVILNAIAEACGVPMVYFGSYEQINENIDKFVCDYVDTQYMTPKKIVEDLLKLSTIIEFCELDESKMTDEDFQEFSEELLRQIKLISYKYKK